MLAEWEMNVMPVCCNILRVSAFPTGFAENVKEAVSKVSVSLSFYVHMQSTLWIASLYISSERESFAYVC